MNLILGDLGPGILEAVRDPSMLQVVPSDFGVDRTLAAKNSARDLSRAPGFSESGAVLRQSGWEIRRSFSARIEVEPEGIFSLCTSLPLTDMSSATLVER